MKSKQDMVDPRQFPGRSNFHEVDRCMWVTPLSLNFLKKHGNAVYNLTKLLE